MANNRKKIILEDMEQRMQYKILETASDRNEIEDVARKRGLIVPSPDISLFKGKYSRAGVFNSNGSRIKKFELEKALATLTLKPVTLNHKEKEIIGIWLDAYMDGDDVIAYGAIYKDNYGDQFAKFEKDFQNGDIGISYELYGDKQKVSAGKYEFSDIYFCGGALLDKGIKPAVKGSKVYEFAMVKEVGANDTPLTLCNKCQFKFDASTVKPEENGGIKCPACKEIMGLNVKTEIASDIHCTCPCGNSTWDSAYDLDGKVVAKCTSCQTPYIFELEEINTHKSSLGYNIALEGRVNCYQCNNPIKYPIFANRKKTSLICKKCGLKFIHKRKSNETNFKIKSMMEFKEEKMNELQKAFSSVEKVDDVTEDMIKLFESASDEDKATLDEKVKEMAKAKISKKSYECECIKCGNKAKSAGHCVDFKCSKCGGQMRRADRPGIGRDKGRLNRVLKIAKGMKSQLKLRKKELASNVLINGIKKLALEIMNNREDIKVISNYEKELASTKETAAKEVAQVIETKDKEIASVKDSYKEEAKTIFNRKQELGDYAEAMSDEDLLDEKNYKIAKLEKELASKKVKDTAVEKIAAEKNTANVVVGSNDDEPVVSKEDKEIDEYNERFTKASAAEKAKINKTYN